MKFQTAILYLLFLFGISSCMDTCNCCNTSIVIPRTVAIHSPIYPKDGNNVTFTLFLKNNGEPKKVELFVKKRTIDPLGMINPFSAEETLRTWNNPVNFPLTHPFYVVHANELTTYTFKITYGNSPSDNYQHQVTFATNPYPFSGHPDLPEADVPAPVYVTGDVDHSCNIVFIPDNDLVGVERMPGSDWEPYFYTSVRDNILHGLFGEPHTSQFIHSYNIFINPHIGHFNPDTDVFDPPDNLLNIDNFCQGKSYMHNKEFQEYANNSVAMLSFTNRIYNRGYFMHESGHVLYFLADEYEFGKHWQFVNAPNNWVNADQALSWTDAHNDAPSYSLSDEHIFHLDEDPVLTDHCHILCPYEGCQMGMGGTSVIPYGKPCKKAITYWMDIHTQ